MTGANPAFPPAGSAHSPLDSAVLGRRRLPEEHRSELKDEKKGSTLMRNATHLAIGLATLALTGTLVACGSSANNGPKSLISEIKASGELKVGFAEDQPLQYQDPNTHQWQGIYVDLMKDWATALNVKLDPVATTWDNMIAGLQAKQFDFGSAINARPARALSVTFSDPVTTELGTFDVYSQKSNITTFAQLNTSSTTVCVPTGSAEDLTLTDAKFNVQIMRVADDNTCRLALLANRAQAIFDDWESGGQMSSANAGVGLLFPPTPMVNEGICYAIRPGYTVDDLAALNVEIKSFAARGLLAVSEKKWGSVDPLKYVVGTPPPYVQTLAAEEFPSQ